MKKKYLIILSLILSVSQLSAQWSLFPVNQKSFYEYENLSDTTINIYFHDSITNIGSSQILHFDYSTHGYGNCYGTVNEDPLLFHTLHFDDIRPDAIIKTNDSLLLAFTYGGSLPLKDSILFLPETAIGNSWTSSINTLNANYNFLQFTCDSLYLDSITGNLVDSVKTFSIQAYNNSTPITSDFDQLEIILSKNYGLKQFVSFYQFNNFQTHLIGIDSITLQAGFELPQFSDYFHLSTNDVLIWKEDFNSFDPMTPNTVRFFKDSIVNTIINSDSVIYDYIRTRQNGTQINGAYRFYKDRLDALNFSTTIYCDRSTMIGQFGGTSPNNLIESSSISITEDSIVNREYGYNGFYYNPANCVPDVMADLWSGMRYNTKYGLVSYYGGSINGTTTTTIVGSTINSIKEGDNFVTGINELNSNKPTFSISPNPSSSGNILINGKDITEVVIYDIAGQLIKAITVNNTEVKINLEDQPQGIYFVKAIFKNSDVVTKKLIIN